MKNMASKFYVPPCLTIRYTTEMHYNNTLPRKYTDDVICRDI